MTFDYSVMQVTARELIAEFNQGNIKLVKVVSGTGPAYNPGDPTETEYDLYATAKAVSNKYIDGQKILVTDIEVTAAIHATQTPTLKDRISIDGVKHEIIDIKVIPPSGTPIVTKLFVRL